MIEEKKKALIITTVSGFLQQFERSNVKLLQEMGYEIHYASNFHYSAYKQEYNYADENIQLHPIPIRKSPWKVKENVQAFFQLRHLIRQESFQLIHCHNPMGGVLGRFVTLGIKKKPWIIYTAHGFHFYQGASWKNWLFYYNVERLLAHRTNCLITINQEDYKQASKFRMRKGGFVAQIPGVGVDVEMYSALDQKQSRKELGIPENSLFLLSVGEINENKNHIAVIQALGRLQDKTLFYGICGSGDKEYEQFLLRQATAMGVASQVRLFGYQEQVSDYLQLADVFVFPSIREGLGMAALEAMAAGLPLITADNRGTREYMIDRKTGIVVQPDDIQGYADAIIAMKSDSYRRMTGKNCREQVRKFGKQHSMEAMREIYQECERRM